MATAIAALLVISAMPAPPSASLERHSATQLQGAIHGLLGRIADESPTGLAPGLLPALPMEGAPRDGNAHVLVHFLAGERSWAQWIPVHGAKAIDLDGDGTSELSVGVEGTTSRWLAVSGTSPADVAWAAWIEQDAAKWGVTGFGLSPSIRVGFSEGELLLAEHGLTGAWHAAFANVDKHQRALAWLHDPGFLRDFTAAVGLGYHVGIQQGGKGGIRLMLLDNEAKVPHDLTLRDAPTGAVIARDPDGALHYRAPTPGGALSSASDAAPIGQPGDLDVTAAPLPTSFTVQPRGPGFDVDSEEPTDLVLKWQPPAGAGVGIVGNGVRDLHVAPGAAGGLVVRGNEGRVAVSDLDSLGGPGAPVGGHVVDLGTEGALAVSQTSPITPAAVALMLGGVVLWAMRAKWNAGPKPA